MNGIRSLSATFLIDLMENQRYGVEYQPIVELSSQETYAYESLSRFFDRQGAAIRPDLVYASLHKSPLSLFQVEYQQKKLQLSNISAKAPLFVNLDQDAYFSCEVAGEENLFLELFKRERDAGIVVELIENSEINDAIMSLQMIEVLSQNGIKTAIDDLFSPLSMISTFVIQRVPFIKLDKHIVVHKRDEQLLQLAQSIIQYARQTGKRSILEGIENEEDLLVAKYLQVDYVQGFLFKDRFIRAS